MSTHANPMTRVPYRGFESQFALPFAGELASLGAMIPFAFLPFSSRDMVIGGTVAAGATAYGACTQEDDCWITHLTGSTSNPATHSAGGNFTFQVYDSERQQLWTPQPILFANGLGTAKRPFYLRKIYKLPAQGQLKCAVVNLASFAAEIQVVCWGLRRDTWKAVNS